MSTLIPKGWIKIPHRNKSEYKEGVQFFMDFAMKHSLPGLTTCSCPCKICRNVKRASFEVVRRHLIINGMLPTYDVWSLHGEKPGMDMTGGPCALEKYNELEAAEQRQKLAGSASGHGGVSSLEDLETDPIVEIFGVDKKSRCRAVSSTSSVKQVKIRQAAKAIASKNTNPEVLQRLDNVEVMLREILTYVYTTHQPQNPILLLARPRQKVHLTPCISIELLEI